MYLQKTPKTGSRPAFNRSRIDGGNRLSTIGIGRISLAPDARYSIASGAPSNFRPSAFPGAGARRLINVPRASKIPDSRNMRDKEVQYDMIRKIVSFLEDCVSPSPSFKFDDRDFLRIPNRNHFKDVFEFLFRCIQPNYQSFPQQKFNEEVVKLLNGLGYPYNLKNSTMQTMTTTATWPLVLAVLEWLVNFVELEQTLHDDRRVGDQEKWQLYVSCYKKKLEMRAPSGPSVKFEHDLFTAEFETYRNSKLGIDGDESLDELRNRRFAFDEELKRIRMLIADEEEAILDLKKNISGSVADIKAVEKYLEGLNSATAVNSNTIDTYEERCAKLLENIEELEQKRLAKEKEIANQKMSGEEARQLVIRRQMLEQELSTLNNRLAAEEKKLYELQPQLFRQNSKACADFKSFVGRLLDLCKSFSVPDELQQQIKQYGFIQTVEDFKKSSVENIFSQLIEKLKESAELKKNAYLNFIEDSNKKKNDLLKELDALKSSLDRCLEGKELENERFKRELDDEFRPIRTAKHNLDIAKQKHQTTSADLDKHNGILNSIGEELADKHKKYLQYKQSLNQIYDEFQTVTMDNMTKLCNRYEQQHKQKIRLGGLGELLLKEKKEMIEKLDSEEKGDNLMEEE